MIVKLATKGADYARCKRHFSVAVRYEYPTVMAERDNELVGYLTTNTKSGYIVAGPLWIKEDLKGAFRGLVLIRLLEAYEKVLFINGVDRFLFWIGPSDEHYVATIKKAIDLVPFEIDADGKYWFKKVIEKELV